MKNYDEAFVIYLLPFACVGRATLGPSTWPLAHPESGPHAGAVAPPQNEEGLDAGHAGNNLDSNLDFPAVLGYGVTV